MKRIPHFESLVKSPGRFGYCVKCGFSGPIPPDAVPLTGVRPRWSRFVECYICPSCGDEKGHFGLLDLSGEVRPREREGRKPPAPREERPKPSEEERRILDALSRIIISALDPEDPRLLSYLTEGRGYPEDLARRLVERGYRWLDPKRLRGIEVEGDKVGLHAAYRFGARGWRPVIPKGEGLLIPVADEEGRILGFQVRRADGEEGEEEEKKARYKWLSAGRKGAYIPLAHVAWPERPKGEGVAVCEGPLKAEVVAHFLGLERAFTDGHRALPLGPFGPSDVADRDVSVLPPRRKPPVSRFPVGPSDLETENPSLLVGDGDE